MHVAAPTVPMTKCARMKCTEDDVRDDAAHRNGMNGASATAAATAAAGDCTKSQYVQGGRLKFFKDGKFILELERAREGERVSWVSVPRKTFWPPQGTAASTPTYRQESSTSLSVSDDNSSIQSSPWQRDHSWKQTNPRRNQSKELEMMLWRPVRQRKLWKRSRKRRRPYSQEIDQLLQTPELSAGRMNSTKKLLATGAAKGSILLTIVQTLIEKTVRLNSSTPPRSSCEVVSPRKRFLREMESRAQVDDGCLKRSRSKPQPNNSPAAVRTPPTPVTPNSKSDSPAANGSDTVDAPPKPTPKSSSYSINSLLAEERHPKTNSSPSHYHHHHPQHHPAHPHLHHQQHHHHYSTPPPDDRLYTESVDKLRSIELSHHDKRAPYHPAAAAAAAVFPPPPPPYMHSYMYPYHVSSLYNASIFSRGGAPGAYPLPPAVYHAGVQAPAPINAMLQRHEAPPPPPPAAWMTAAPGSTAHLRDERRDEPIADMPLNLSKHAG